MVVKKSEKYGSMSIHLTRGDNLCHKHVLITVSYVTKEISHWTRQENKVYLGSYRSDFYFVKHRWTTLTSFGYIKCHFMK